MHSAVQILPLTWHPQTEVSCSTWGSCCFQTAWSNCTVSTALPVSLVAPSGRDVVADAPFAEVILSSENFVLVIPFRIDDSLDVRVQRPTVPPLVSSPLKGPPGKPLDDSPLPNCPIRDIALTERDKHLLTELRRASAMALPRCVVSRYATAWAESLERAVSGQLGA